MTSPINTYISNHLKLTANLQPLQELSSLTFVDLDPILPQPHLPLVSIFVLNLVCKCAITDISVELNHVDFVKELNLLIASVE